MPLSESALNEIRAELTQLHQAKVRIDERVRALESILTPFDFSDVGLAVSRNGQSTKDGHGSADLTDAEVAEAFGDIGFRSAVLGILEEIGPARAPQVAEVMLSRGFKDTGKTRFSTRVYNDLWRMSNVGKINNEDGLFSVKK